MDSHKNYAEDYEETELFGQEIGHLAGDAASAPARRKPLPGRPARQRLEQLVEEERLKRQLSDWDHLDFEDDEDFEPPL